MLWPQFQLSPETRRRCLRGLVKICGEHSILPNSYAIPQCEIRKLGGYHVSSREISDAWPGMYGEDTFVAVKVVRYHPSDYIRKIKKVRYLTYSPHHNRVRPFAELFPKGHNLEAPVSPQHTGVDRGHD